jgi:hypothetical protein
MSRRRQGAAVLSALRVGGRYGPALCYFLKYFATASPREWT